MALVKLIALSLEKSNMSSHLHHNTIRAGRISPLLVVTTAIFWVSGCGVEEKPPALLSQSGDQPAPAATENRAELRTRAIIPAGQQDDSRGIIQVELRYQNPRAAEVQCVWGVNDFSYIPKQLPPETFLTYGNSHMNSPMQRDGDEFIVQFEVPAGSKLDYGFMITRTSTGQAVQIWDADSANGGAYYATTLTAANADKTVIDTRQYLGAFGSGEWIDLHTTAIVPADREKFPGQGVVRVRFEYHDPAAGEVVLVWGINGFKERPAQMPPGTFLTYGNSHMNTPMPRTGEVFTAEIEVSPNAKLDYGFSVTRSASGDEVKLWKAADGKGTYFSKTVAIEAADETIVDPKQYAGKFGSAEWMNLRTKAVVPADREKYPDQGVVQVRVEYHDPAAGEAVLVWGLDDFKRRPAQLPAGTFLTYGDSHMNTPMRREGDLFVADLEVQGDGKLNYGISIPRTATGDEAKLWKGADSQGGYFAKQLSIGTADETVVDPKYYVGKFGSAEWINLHTKAIVPADREKYPEQGSVQVRVEYHDPAAGEAVLVWGLDDFKRRPAQLPAGTFLTYGDSHMNTPMRREGGLFVVDLEVQGDGKLNYGISIPRTATGDEAKLWRGADSQGGYFAKQLSIGTADETVVDPKYYVGKFGSAEWINLHAKAIVPADREKYPDQGSVQVRVEYHDPAAGEAVLVWGLDDFKRRPAQLPAETFLTYGDSHMNTPMRREGDLFVADLEVQGDGKLSYGISIPRTAKGDEAKLWRGADTQGGYFAKPLSTSSADETVVDPKHYVGKFRSAEWIELQTKPIDSSDPQQSPAAGTIHVDVRYHNPEAGEVTLVWGMDEFKRLPKKLPPETFLTYGDSHLNTPMRKEGDLFSTELEVDSNAVLSYGFSVSRTASGDQVKLWKGADGSGGYFSRSMRTDGAEETIASPGLKPAKAIEVLTQSVAPIDGEKQSGPSAILAKVQLHEPAAGEVTLVWGLDGFSRLPAKLPPGTFLSHNDSHLNTPMRREGEHFVAEFAVEGTAKLDYAFSITRSASGEEANLWKGNNDKGGYFTTELPQGGSETATAESAAPPGIRFDEWSELSIASMAGQTASDNSGNPLVARVSYRDPSAGAMTLVWGIDQFSKVPATLPPESYLTSGGTRVNTPMQREGDLFVVELPVAVADDRLEYAFNVTRTGEGQEVQLWKGAATADGFYSRKLSTVPVQKTIRPEDTPAAGSPASGSPAVSRTPKLSGDHPDEFVQVFRKIVRPSKKIVRADVGGVQVQVRYKNPNAAEVTLIWGFDNFTNKPQTMPPGTYLTYSGTHLNTPMTREGDMFVVDFTVHKETLLNYAFMINKTSDGEPANHYRSDKKTGKDYKAILSAEKADEIVDPDADVVPSGGLPLKYIAMGIVGVLIVGWLVFDFALGKKKAQSIASSKAIEADAREKDPGALRKPNRRHSYRPAGKPPETGGPKSSSEV